MKLTISAFKKLTTAKIKAGLPIEVTSGGKTIFTAVLTSVAVTAPVVVPPVTPVPTPTPILGEPLVQWLAGGTQDSVFKLVNDTYEKAAGRKVVFVTYNIPHRDNANYSAGGAKSAEEYYAWAGAIGAAIGNREAIIVHEPDAVGLSWGNEFSGEARYKQWEYLSVAIDILKKQSGVKIYLDASMWISPEKQIEGFKEIIGRRPTGQQIEGFSVNVSGYTALDKVKAYADPIAKALNVKYVVDTSRNGRGNPHEPNWCNITDTKVGERPIANPTPLVAAYLWIKVPGESDGLGINDDGSRPRQDVPTAGTYWAEYAEAIYSGDWTAFKRKYNV